MARLAHGDAAMIARGCDIHERAPDIFFSALCGALNSRLASTSAKGQAEGDPAQGERRQRRPTLPRGATGGHRRRANATTVLGIAAWRGVHIPRRIACFGLVQRIRARVRRSQFRVCCPRVDGLGIQWFGLKWLRIEWLGI